MADVPEQAAKRASEIDHAAFVLYACYCAHRDQQTGESDVRSEEIHRMTGINTTYISTLKARLMSAGWISCSKRKVTCLIGFEFETLDNPKNSDSTGKTLDNPNIRTGAISDDPVKTLDNPNIPDSETLDNPKNSDSTGKTLDNPKFPPSTPHTEGEYLIKNYFSSSSARAIDESFLGRLQRSTRYRGLNVRDVYEKLLLHVEAENQEFRQAGLPETSVATPRRLVNWLNREGEMSGKRSGRKAKAQADWRAWLEKELKKLFQHYSDPAQHAAIQSLIDALSQLSVDQARRQVGDLEDLGVVAEIAF